jgi:methionyl-tRNA formyltransferase
LGAGEIAASGTDVHVGTGSGPVALGEVRPEGRGAMPADAWLRGSRLAAGDRFE